MITASGGEQRLDALEAGRRRLRHQAVRPERAARPGRVAGADQALPRHRPPAGGRAGRVERRAGVPGGRSRSPSSSGSSRLRRFLSPQLADLVIGDESLLREPPPRDRRGLLRPEELHPVRRDQRARGGDGRARRVPPARWARWSTAYEGTLERFTGDGVMVFFNDPVPCDDAAERAVRMALEIRDAVRELAEGWQRAGHDLALGHGHRAGLRHAGPDRLRGPLRLRRDRQRHQPRRPAVRATPDRGRCWSPTGCWPPSSTLAVAELVGDLQPKGFSRPVRVHNVSAIDERRAVP